MKESYFNTILVRSLKEKFLFAHKISDPVGGLGVKNPHDIYGVFYNRPLYLETKRVPLKSDTRWTGFNFSHLEEHQLDSLLKIRQSLKGSAYCLLALAMYLPRKWKGFLFFDIELIAGLIRAGKKSLLGTELYRLKDFVVPIKADRVIFPDDECFVVENSRWQEKVLL